MQQSGLRIRAIILFAAGQKNFGINQNNRSKACYGRSAAATDESALIDCIIRASENEPDAGRGSEYRNIRFAVAVEIAGCRNVAVSD